MPPYDYYEPKLADEPINIALNEAIERAMAGKAGLPHPYLGASIVGSEWLWPGQTIGGLLRRLTRARARSLPADTISRRGCASNWLQLDSNLPHLRQVHSGL